MMSYVKRFEGGLRTARRWRTALWVSLFVLSGPAVAHSTMEQNLAQSRRTGRPIMVVATRATCQPCQSMKLRLMNDPSLEEFRRTFLIAPMDLVDSDFQWVSTRYPVPFDMVPMVYVIAPSGELLYAKAGALEVDQLVALQASTMTITGAPLTEVQIVQNEHSLKLVREAAIDSHLTKALRLVSAVTSQHSSAASVVTAGTYERRIVQAISDWGSELSGRLNEGNRIHESAYLLAAAYVAIPKKYENLREELIAKIRYHEAQPATQTAILQAKQLVRAKIEERRHLNAEALRSLQQVIELDPDSPSGRYATRRAAELQQRVGTSPPPSVQSRFRRPTPSPSSILARHAARP